MDEASELEILANSSFHPNEYILKEVNPKLVIISLDFYQVALFKNMPDITHLIL